VTTDDEELTAYLDGELDPAAAEVVAARLAANPRLRRRADSFRRAHDLLDYLPKPEPTADFTARTLTRLDIPARHRWRPRVPSRRFAVWALAGLLCIVGGAVARRAADRIPGASRDAEDLVKDNRVLALLPYAVGVDDLEFLRSLARAGLFDTTGPGDVPGGQPPAGAIPPAELIELFRGYPESRRQELRRFAQDFDALPTDDSIILRGVLEAYAVWLDRLLDGERRDILTAATADARLRAVREARERGWLAALPVATRDRITATDDGERPEFVAELREGERERRDAWRAARRQWPTLFGGGKQPPWPFSEPGLPAEIDAFVTDIFRVNLAAKPEPKGELAAGTRLTRGEFAYLKAARDGATREGHWFVYGVALHRLARRHPTLPPPRPGKTTPVTTQTLPTEVPVKLLRGGPKAFDNSTRDKWPDFALEVARKLAADGHRVPASLGPCRPDDFPDAVRDFVTGTLLPRLTDAERVRLNSLEGIWPGYPRAVIELAAAPPRDLPVPTVTLPGAPSLWAKYYDFSPRPAGDGPSH
jgi:hypothetical protein